jgi:cobaltochelatase CobT
VYKLILELKFEEKKEQRKDNSPSQTLPKNNDLLASNEENISQEQVNSQSQESGEKINKKPQTSQFDIQDFSIDQTIEDQSIIDSNLIDSNQISFKKSYQIYSSKFDEIIFPGKFIKKNELKNLRNQLDLRIEKMNSISKKISMKLKRKLLSKKNSFLEYDASRGIIDRKKLSLLISNPYLEDIWINSKNHEYQDTALTILIDNSGSMRGSPIVMSALACEIISDILQNFAVKTEIIGFTTGDWKGGRVKKIWEISGRPANPGRLNELRHIVYKHFNQNYKKAKINLGLMLKEGILKENIDGEALLFAKSRLMQQSEKRKILLVISDGTPVDDSTSSANDEDILKNHLHEVINNIEKKSKIEIVGIGIGHQINEFYRNSISIRNLDELGDAMIEKIANLL